MSHDLEWGWARGRCPEPMQSCWFIWVYMQKGAVCNGTSQREEWESNFRNWPHTEVWRMQAGFVGSAHKELRETTCATKAVVGVCVEKQVSTWPWPPAHPWAKVWQQPPCIPVLHPVPFFSVTLSSCCPEILGCAIRTCSQKVFFWILTARKIQPHW